MSTSNLDIGQLPDIDVLTRLANQYFSALPGTAPIAIAPDLPSSTGHSPSGVTNIRNPQSSLPDPHGLIAEEKLPPVADRLPHSEAGVGTSLSAAPQRAGSELPLGKNDVLIGDLPLVNAPGVISLPFEAELRDMLSSLRLPAQSSTPTIPAAVGPQYYFMEYARGVPAGLQNPGAAGNPLTEQLGVGAGAAKPPLDIELIRRDFPILQERVNGRQLVWLDNAATTQKPASVIERLKYFYEHENSRRWLEGATSHATQEAARSCRIVLRP